MSRFLYQRRGAQEQGFALGAVLLVVVLMAAVIGALAMGGSSSSSLMEQQEGRVSANVVVAQASDLKSNIETAKSITELPIVLDDDAAACLTTPPTRFCLYKLGEAGMLEPKLPARTRTGADPLPAWEYHTSAISETDGAGDVGTATADEYIAIRQVTAEVCTEINEMFSGIRSPSILRSASGGSVSLSFNNMTASEFPLRGCGQDSGGGAYFYYDVVDLN